MRPNSAKQAWNGWTMIVTIQTAESCDGESGAEVFLAGLAGGLEPWILLAVRRGTRSTTGRDGPSVAPILEEVYECRNELYSPRQATEAAAEAAS